MFKISCPFCKGTSRNHWKLINKVLFVNKNNLSAWLSTFLNTTEDTGRNISSIVLWMTREYQLTQRVMKYNSYLIEILIRQQMQLPRLEAVLTFAFIENVCLKFPTSVFFCTRHLTPLCLLVSNPTNKKATIPLPILFYLILDTVVTTKNMAYKSRSKSSFPNLATSMKSNSRMGKCRFWVVYINIFLVNRPALCFAWSGWVHGLPSQSDSSLIPFLRESMLELCKR